MELPIVERLLADTFVLSDAREAAEIIKALVAALEPFDKAVDRIDEKNEEMKRLGMFQHTDNASPGLGIKFGDCRRARAALQLAKDTGKRNG